MTIEEVLSAEETQIFDRKSIYIDPKALAIPIIAFANADGGTVAIGISDKTRRVEGIDDETGKVNELLRVPFDFCVPTVKAEVEKVPCTDFKGRANHVLLMHVEPSMEVHANQADEVFMRVGDKSKKLSFDERMQLMYDKGERFFEDKPVPDADIDDIDMTVVSPGVPLDLPFILKIKSKNIEIIGEVELAYRLSKNPIFIGITGTNGKTTTTSLVGEIFKKANRDTYIVGNIGNPVIDTVGVANENSVLVTELSSFQLESIATFKPHVSAILNFTEDHLNRHHTMEAYMEAKARIFENQDSKDFCVLNYDDEDVRSLSDNVKAKKIFFSRKKSLECGIYLDEAKNIIVNIDEKITLLNKDELKDLISVA